MDKTITIYYWHLSQLPNLSPEHNSEIPFNELNELIQQVFELGYTSMIVPSSNGAIVYIGTGKLSQR